MDFLHSLAQAQPPQFADFINDLARTPLSQVVKFIAVLTVVRLALYPYLKNTPVHKRTGLYGFLRVVNEILDAFVYAGAFVFLIIRPFFLQTFRIPSGSMWPTLHVNDFIVANKAIYRYTDPKFGDIVVFRPPLEATEGRPEQVDEKGEVKVDFIKRLIGEPGDLIELKEGVLYRNGKIAGEEYRHYSMQFGDDFRPLSQEQLDQYPHASFKLVKHEGQVIPLNYTATDANSLYPSAPYAVTKKYVIEDPAVQMRLKDAPAEKVPTGFYLMMGDNRNGSLDGRSWGLVPRDAIIGRSEFIWLPLSRWQRTR